MCYILKAVVDICVYLFRGDFPRHPRDLCLELAASSATSRRLYQSAELTRTSWGSGARLFKWPLPHPKLI